MADIAAQSAMRPLAFTFFKLIVHDDKEDATVKTRHC
jgi:hypothetical protein